MATVLVPLIQIEVFLYKDWWFCGYSKVLIKREIASLAAVWFKPRNGNSRRDASVATGAVGSVHMPASTTKSVVDQSAVQFLTHGQARVDKQANRDALRQVIASLGWRGVE